MIFSHNLRIWSCLIKQIASHSLCRLDHARLVICSSALYSNNGVWSAFLLELKSQIYALLSSPTEHMWTADWGAHAIAFTLFLWFRNLHKGIEGFLC